MKARIRLMQLDLSVGTTHAIMVPTMFGHRMSMLDWERDVAKYELGAAVARLRRWPALHESLVAAIRVK